MEDYDFKIKEKEILKFWQNKKIYKFKPGKKIYSIDTPPPYISGKMHIGHAFSYAQQDFIARFRRMHDGSIFYPFGIDDNGLPTERFVEKKNNVSSKNMKRSEFIDLCLKTIKETTSELVQDWKDIGLSADFEKYYSTIDKPTQKISQKSFIELFKKGEIYNKEFQTIYCCECGTSIAQAELEDKEKETLFTTLKFSCNNKELLIATTRPELLPACVAVFVNPKDERYKKLVGKKAKVPLFNQEVPIIADESAQIDKGTGVLMICSYGYKYDAHSINKHNLNPKIIISKDGRINFPGYEGLRIKEARKKVLDDLKNADLIVEQKQIKHSVNVHERCGVEIEIIPTKQWFVKILDKKKQLTEQGRKIKWHPEFMRKRYENWVEGLEWDWNISRNRHFGVPIPAWHCEKCKEFILPEEKELPVEPTQTKKVCKKCNGDAEGEKMVLDTWATSSLTPQIGASLSEKKVSIPFSLRPQGHDIIRTWAFYTIVKAFLHEKKIPWEEIAVSGNVSLGGEKMSKSKGNIIEPRAVLDSYGADALRFWASGSKLGEDLDYSEKELVAGKKLVNKLWNSSKFVKMSIGDYNKNEPKKIEKIDEIFLNKLNETIDKCTHAFLNYEYSKARNEIESFFWKMFCDNYLELVKYRVYNNKNKESACYVLHVSMQVILKLFAPIMPFITEEIYQTFFKEKEESIHLAKWPKKIDVKKSNLEVLDILIDVLTKIRMEKSKAQKSMKAEVELTLEKEKQDKLKLVMDDLQSVMSIKKIKTGSFQVEFV